MRSLYIDPRISAVCGKYDVDDNVNFVNLRSNK